MEVSGDIDFTNQSAKLTGQMPGIPGAAGEIIISNQMAYIRRPGDSKYTAAAASNLMSNPADPTQGASYVIGMIKVAADNRLQPQLIGSEQLFGSLSYHIRVIVDPVVANSVLNGVGSTLGSGQLDIWIMHDGFRVSMMEFRTSDPKAGQAAFRLELYNYGEPLTITAPPNDQWDVSGLPSA